MDILFSTTSHAAIISATDDGGDRRSVAALPVILEGQYSPVREQARTLREAATSFATEAAKIVTTYTPAARVGQLRALAARTLAKPAQRLMEAGQAEARAIAAAWLRLTAVPAADATMAMLRQSDRTAFASLAIGDKAAWVERASVDQLSAIIEAGHARFPDLTGEIWDHAERRYAALNFIRIAGTAADHARKPSVNEPLAIGIDMDAAERAANEGLERHRQRNDIIDAVEQAVQGITSVVALTCGMDVHAAFDLLTGKVPA